MSKLWLLILGTCLCAQSSSASFFDIVWDEMEGMIETTDNGLSKVHPDGWGNNAAFSGNYSNPSAAALYVLDYDTTYRKHAFGISAAFETAHYNSIDYCFYMENGNLFILEDGVLIGNFGTLGQGDELKILKRHHGSNGNDVRYYHNGTLIQTSTAVLPGPMHLKATCYYSGDAFGAMRASVMGQLPIDWDYLSSGIQYLEPGSELKKTGPHTQNDYVISKNFIAPGEEGSIQARCGFNGSMYIGLTDQNTTHPMGLGQLNHGIAISGNAARVRENMNIRATVWGAPKWHRFSIQIKDDTVRYYRGQTLLHETPKNTTDTLWVVSQIYSSHPSFGTDIGWYNLYADFGSKRNLPPVIDPLICQAGFVYQNDSLLTEGVNSQEHAFRFKSDSLNSILYFTSSNSSYTELEDSSLSLSTPYVVNARVVETEGYSEWGPSCEFTIEPNYTDIVLESAYRNYVKSLVLGPGEEHEVLSQGLFEGLPFVLKIDFTPSIDLSSDLTISAVASTGLVSKSGVALNHSVLNESGDNFSKVDGTVSVNLGVFTDYPDRINFYDVNEVLIASYLLSL